MSPNRTINQSLFLFKLHFPNKRICINKPPLPLFFSSKFSKALCLSMAKLILSALFSLFLLLSTTINAYATSFTLTNNCAHTVWPGVLSNPGKPLLSSTGFALDPSGNRTLDAPPSWAGRLWARTICSTDPSGRFSCATGDCGSGTVECSGNGAVPPATLAQFTLNGDSGLDFYDVSLVDGYNVPMLVVPQGRSGGGCGRTGCIVDLNMACPTELRVVGAEGGKVVACKSACEAFRSPEYCCTGSFASPKTCTPSHYSQLFKTACPKAYSYAFDDLASTFTCASVTDYLITFCPSSSNNSVKSSDDQNVAVPPTMSHTKHVMSTLNLVAISFGIIVFACVILILCVGFFMATIFARS